MSHFSINYSDFSSPDSVFKAIAKNQKNPITTTPLTSSGSKSGDPQFLTTASIADIQQGSLLYKPRALMIDNQEAALSRSFQGLIEHEDGGRGNIDNVISAGTKPFVTPSIRDVVTDTPQGIYQINDINGAIANGAISGGSSVEYHYPPDIKRMHDKVTLKFTYIDGNPGAIPYPWRLIGRIKDSELRPGDFENIENGFVPVSMLTSFNKSNKMGADIGNIPKTGQLWTPAAVSFQRLMNAAIYYGFTGPFVTDTYRSYQVQDAAYKGSNKQNDAGEFTSDKHGLINPAGISNHGFGLAVDLHEHFRIGRASGRNGNKTELSGIDWMYLNSWKYGWVHPEWALPMGFHTEEWHWEYRGHLHQWYPVDPSARH